jgi:large subunit ribosomal protein L15e
MGSYGHIEKTFQNEYKARSVELRNRLNAWNSGEVIVRIDRPTNISRARSLGYKAKQGVILVRVRVGKGLSKRQKPAHGRKPSKMGRFYAYRKSLQSVAEERAARRFSNCEILNSYYVGEDGGSKYFEIMLLDRSHPAIASDPDFSRILGQKNRVYRGLTSSGRAHRGLFVKGKGAEKVRPSIRSKQRHFFRG